MGRAVLISSLSVDDCRRRLRRNIEKPWAIFGGDGVIGSVRRSSAWIRRRVWYRSSSAVMRIDIESRDGGTGLACQDAMGVGQIVQIALLITVLALIGWELLLPMLTRRMQVRGDPDGLIVPGLGLLAAMGLASMFFHYLSRRDRTFLLEFVAKTTEAHPE